VFQLCAGALEIRASKASHGMNEALLNMPAATFIDAEIY
jgi:hypothetical protein